MGEDKISDDCFKSYKSISVSDIGGYSDTAIWEDKLFILYEKTAQPFELFFEEINIPK